METGGLGEHLFESVGQAMEGREPNVDSGEKDIAQTITVMVAVTVTATIAMTVTRQGDALVAGYAVAATTSFSQVL